MFVVIKNDTIFTNNILCVLGAHLHDKCFGGIVNVFENHYHLLVNGETAIS